MRATVHSPTVARRPLPVEMRTAPRVDLYEMPTNRINNDSSGDIAHERDRRIYTPPEQNWEQRERVFRASRGQPEGGNW